jgi:hypothetical protein
MRPCLNAQCRWPHVASPNVTMRERAWSVKVMRVHVSSTRTVHSDSPWLRSGRWDPSPGRADLQSARGLARSGFGRGPVESEFMAHCTSRASRPRCRGPWSLSPAHAAAQSEPAGWVGFACQGRQMLHFPARMPPTADDGPDTRPVRDDRHLTQTRVPG